MLKKMILFTLLFCYIFAFYIAGVSVSLLISLPLYGYAVINRSYYYHIVGVCNTSYIRNVFIGWLLIVGLSFLFPVLFFTFDLSFLRVVGIQILHLLAAIPLFAYLKYKDYSCAQVENAFVWVFIVQTLIQCVVVSDATLSEIIVYFNKFDLNNDEGGLGSGIRGKALSAATTYHLSLVYGIGFIVYVKVYLSRKISLLYVIMGLLIFVGIFFSGRTGFVGVGIGMFAFLVSRKVSLGKKIKFFFQICVTLLGIVCMLNYFLPDFYSLLEKRVFPYAFEFIYSLDKSEQMEMASTNQLMEMWTNRDFNYIEFLIGSGRYTSGDGSYYMHVDPGILRHTLFMGIVGYLCLVYYQLLLLPIWKMNKITRFYYGLILLYLFIMDFKGCTIGTNKFAFAASLLLSYSYFELSKTKNEKESYG